MEQVKNMKENALLLGQKIMEIYWGKIYQYLEKNPPLIKTFPALLLHREKLAFYFGKTHLAIEYFGPETTTELNPDGKVDFHIFDYSRSDENFIEKIIGFEFKSTSSFEFLLPDYAEDLIIPTNVGFDKLMELNWNFNAQDGLMAFNAGNFYIEEGKFVRWVNSFFFDADEIGLKTRQIKWIDFIPIKYKLIDKYERIEINLNYLANLVEHDANYSYPLPDKHDYKFVKLPQINRFIELIGTSETKEPEITIFLEKDENRFILSMAFLAKGIYPQLICDWQSEEKDSIQPDFFILQHNGFANIIEFKLPNLKNSIVIGRTNRETFSAEINSYISQTRVYKTYFDDPNNREWFETKYGFKVFHPKRILVMGRRIDFNDEEWKEIIADYRDIEIYTYDDIVSGVVAQLYL